MNVQGKIMLITGSTDGLGRLIAEHMVRMNASVLLHGRNEEKGKSVQNELSRIMPRTHLKYYNADFSSLKEVSDVANNIKAEQDHIDVLINNAAIGSGKMQGNNREFSADGIELRFAVNYVAQVLFTEKLLSLIKPGSVIINVVSVAQARIDFHDMKLDKAYDGYHAYARSKTALIMYTFDLAERMKDKNIMINAVHPASLMNTKMVLKDWGYTLSTVEQGAEAVENLITTSVTGTYFDGKKHGKVISQAFDLDARRKLKEYTWEIIGKYI
jgi:NAD(P)-dependent dehydrogenase (short-subunit alcohol dehydrogenase family)